MYDSKYSFSDYKNVGKYYNLSFTTKYDTLLSFYNQLQKFRNLVSQTEKTKIKKKSVYKNSAILYNTLLHIYFSDYNNIMDENKKKLIKNMMLVIYFSKVINMMNGRKRMQEKINHSQKKLFLKTKSR